MPLEQDIALLSGVPFFSDMPADQLRLLAFSTERRAVNKGDILFREYDEADCCYVIVSGQIALLKPGALPSDDDMVESLHGAGEIIEQMALIASTRRGSVALCDENADLLRIDRAVFKRVLEEFPELAAKLKARIEADLAQVLSKLDRVAHYFETDEEDTSVEEK